MLPVARLLDRQKENEIAEERRKTKLRKILVSFGGKVLQDLRKAESGERMVPLF